MPLTPRRRPSGENHPGLELPTLEDLYKVLGPISQAMYSHDEGKHFIRLGTPCEVFDVTQLGLGLVRLRVR
jgi:hypothetical protein